MVLEGKKIPFEKVDISLVDGAKEKMREICGDEKCLPPQLCKGDTYLGVSLYSFPQLTLYRITQLFSCCSKQASI